FNLIWRRDRVAATLLHRPLVGPMVFFEEAGVSWLAHLMSGQAAFRDLPRPLHLAAGDSVLLQPDPAGPSRLILSGGGELCLARLAPPAVGARSNARAPAAGWRASSLPLHLAAGDRVLLQPDPAGPSRLILSGGGELLLARLAPPAI